MKEIVIDGVKYIPKKEALDFENFQNGKLCAFLIGKYVIVRSYNEGINAGTVEAADETGIVLKDCRRLWYHELKDKSVSWYEGVALSGLSENTKVSPIVPFKVIIEDYSATIVMNIAKKSITEFVSHAQT